MNDRILRQFAYLLGALGLAALIASMSLLAWNLAHGQTDQAAGLPMHLLHAALGTTAAASLTLVLLALYRISQAHQHLDEQKRRRFNAP